MTWLVCSGRKSRSKSSNLVTTMMRLRILLCWLLAGTCWARLGSPTDRIVLESFDHPQHEWKEMNDPVMGGQSTGTFVMENGTAVFAGSVVDVPFLHAPGFLQARTVDSVPFPDVSHCQALELIGRSATHYTGYRVSFGTAHAPGGKFFAYGYKATVKVSDEWTSLVIPFDNFTDFWDDATGDPIHTCAENALYCPDVATLRNLHRLAVWAEGVAGEVHWEIQSIAAVGCASHASWMPMLVRGLLALPS